MNGVVKSFNRHRGYGFIVDEQGNTIFFHYSELQMDGYKTVTPDTKVTFDKVDTDKGQRAVNIHIVE